MVAGLSLCNTAHRTAQADNHSRGTSGDDPSVSWTTGPPDLPGGIGPRKEPQVIDPWKFLGTARDPGLQIGQAWAATAFCREGMSVREDRRGERQRHSLTLGGETEQSLKGHSLKVNAGHSTKDERTVDLVDIPTLSRLPSISGKEFVSKYGVCLNQLPAWSRNRQPSMRNVCSDTHDCPGDGRGIGDSPHVHQRRTARAWRVGTLLPQQSWCRQEDA